MLSLFVIYLGGAHEKSLIELHDIRFIAANTIEETYSALKKDGVRLYELARKGEQTAHNTRYILFGPIRVCSS